MLHPLISNQIFELKNDSCHCYDTLHYISVYYPTTNEHVTNHVRKMRVCMRIYEYSHCVQQQKREEKNNIDRLKCTPT